MDQQKDFIRNLLIAGLVFIGVMLVLQKVLPTPQSRPVDSATPATAPGPQSADGTSAESTPGGTATADSAPITTASSDTAGAPATSGLRVVEAEAEVTLEMGAPLPEFPEGELPRHPPAGEFRMHLTLSNVGASIESALMADYWAILGKPDLYRVLAPALENDLDGRMLGRTLAVDSITIDGGTPLPLANRKWHVEPTTGVQTDDQGRESVTFRLRIDRDEDPFLSLTRRYVLAPEPKDSGRFDLSVELDVENLSPEPHEILIAYRAGMGIQREAYRLDDRFFDLGVRTEGQVAGSRQPVAGLTRKFKSLEGPELNIDLFRPNEIQEGKQVVWAATANKYFTCTVAPLKSGQGQPDANKITAVQAADLDGLAQTDHDRTLRFVTAATDVAPGSTLHYPADVFIGPKVPGPFKQLEPYAERNYYYQISQGYSVLCTFTFLVEFMVWLLNALETVVFNYGIAIIILVLIVRGLLHPLTKKGQINMVRMQHRMQELAPKIEEIKKKYANDKQRLNQEMMKLNINPAGQMLTCLPMAIQMPIWVALWISLSNNILMRHEPFFWWINDLAAPDALYTFAKPVIVPLLGWSIASMNLLPILLGIFMYTQQKLTPKPKPSPNMSDQQIQQQQTMQKMMPLMSIMMLVIFYKAPSGLTLYIMSSSLFGTIEQYLIRKHIKLQEAAGTLHKPAKPKLPPDSDAPGKPRRAGFMDRLHRLADDAQKQAHGGKTRPKRPRP